METMELSLKSIAQDIEAKALGIESSASSVLRWLSREERDWLLIYDNADGRPEDIEAYMPPGSRGNILLTSRNPNMRQFVSQQGAIVQVVDMAENDATSLLLNWVTTESLTADVESLARSIVRTLYCLPLAVDQAGAAIHSGLCTIDEYSSLYLSRRKDLMSHPSFKGASNHGRVAYTTWDLSYNTIHAAALEKGHSSNMSSDAAESAMLIIDTFAFFHNDQISEEIIKRAAESPKQLPWCSDKSLTTHDDRGSYNNDKFYQKLAYRFLALDSSGRWNPLPFREGIQILISFSLISVDTNRRSYSLHPLVHSWSRDRLTEEGQKVRCRSASALLAHSITRKFLSTDYDFRLNLIPHIKSCNLHSANLEHYTAEEFTSFGLAYHENGYSEEAEKLRVKALEMGLEVLGREHPDTLQSMSDLARTYMSQGRHKDAEKLESNASELMKKVLGREHPDTLASMSNLASIYWNQGRYNEAEKLGSETLELKKKVLGEKHPDTLESMNDLASTYLEQGRHKEAEKLGSETLELRKKVLGREHPDTLQSMNDLASTYWEQGHYKEAEKVGLETLELRKKVLGREHPYTLTSMATLAVTYRSQGRHEEAEKLKVKILELSEKVLGREHPDTLISMSNLASTWKDLGRDTDAIALMRESVDLSMKILGADHPQTVVRKGWLKYWGDSR